LPFELQEGNVSQYSFSEADAGIPGRERLEMLAGATDTGTIEHLVRFGVGEGWRCAEVGAGAGTIARWLGDQVGSSGHVLATDLDTQWLADLAESGVEVRVQDIAVDAPGDSYFDLVHARAVLTHVRDLHLAIGHMVAALRPGGWILLEEYDQGQPFGRTSPEEPLVARFVEAEVALVKKAGGDPYLGGRLPSAIREHGLTGTGVHARYFHLTPQIVQIQLDGVGDTIVSQGAMQRAELDKVRDFINDPANLMYGPMLVAAWGRKPA
jgi:ubiquinone/menaquinone biosynthesis C-methylase UbiE